MQVFIFIGDENKEGPEGVLDTFFWSGKTGMGKANGIVVDAWFTGFAESAAGDIYSCVRLGRTDGMDVSSSLAKEIAIKNVTDYCE